MIELSKRLTTVAELVIPAAPLADIGTDHALLPTYLIQQGIIPRAVAGDIHAGPVLAAERQVKAVRYEEYISVRAGNGLEVVKPGEVETVTIAGMGGGTIVDILSSGSDVLHDVKRLVLQPNIGEQLVRGWLLQQGWKLVAERLIEEDGLLYEVIAADRSETKAQADAWNHELYSKAVEGYGPIPISIQLLLGPLLLEQPSVLFFRKWNAYVDKLSMLIRQMERAKSSEARVRREAFLEEQRQISEVLACLSKSKPL